MEKHTNLEYYHSGTGKELYKTNSYIYEIEVNKMSANRFEFVGTRFVYTKEYKEIKSPKYKKLDSGEIICTEITLVGAPEKYLIENNYEKRNN